jgi:hypothetical protein
VAMAVFLVVGAAEASQNGRAVMAGGEAQESKTLASSDEEVNS